MYLVPRSKSASLARQRTRTLTRRRRKHEDDFDAPNQLLAFAARDNSKAAWSAVIRSRCCLEEPMP